MSWSVTQAQGTAAKFDHLKTGFALTGVHTTTRCESCHVNAVFKGTPKDCASCHTSGLRLARNNVVKPSAHVPTQLGCETCHTTQAFAGAKFNHTGVVAGTCSTCHSGVMAPGKPSGHIQTQASCDSCHKTTTAWLPVANVDHAAFTAATNCASCHNGTAATGKTGVHIPTVANCTSCHSVAGWKPTSWNHTQTAVANQCSTCHSGSFPPADGTPANHIPYASLNGVTIGNCDSCHKGGFASWNPGQFHKNISVSSQCATCHLTGSFGLTAKPATPIHASVTGNCESCHKTGANWGGAKVDHSAFNAGTNCASCHNGSAATGKASIHIPTIANCASCHSVAGWKPTAWNHTQAAVANQCSTCHSGTFPPADGPVANHIPYTSLSGVSVNNCDSCHKGGYASWNPGLFHSNVAVSNQCATCHLSSNFGLTSKPATAVHASVTGNCETCHKSTANWSAAKPDHSKFTAATNCASCHNGSGATGKSGIHIPTTANCASCHSVAGWKPTSWNHTQSAVANQCSTCHSGSFPPADGPVANHIPYASLTGVSIPNCDSCHKGGYASWNPGQFHKNVAISSQCASCHLSGAFGLTSKPATPIHASVTGSCETCHKTSANWAGAKVDHSTFTAATNCASCHNGSSATGKASSHIPTVANCASCHSVAGWKPTAWNHTQAPVANQCSTCHSGSFPPADGPVANHIPYASLSGVSINNCDSCHKGGYASWNPGQFHKNVGVSTQCATCHLSGAYGLTSKPATVIHASVTGNCETCHKSTAAWAGAKVDHSTFTAATNCASCHNGSAATGKSGTHIPTTATCGTCHNVTGWTPSKWNHTQAVVANQCGTCHTGSFPPADGPVANHIPYKTLTGVAINNCDSCHKAGFASWNPGLFHSNVSVSNQCATCHLSGTYGLTSKPATAVHASVTGNCETCHKTTSSWAGAKVDHSTFTVATNCASCHNGSAATGKSGTHIPTSATCGTCHNVTGWMPSKWNHTQAVVANQCGTCHTGSFPPADGPVANHIPYKTLTGVVITNCDSCHKAGYASWNPGLFHTNVSVSNQCASCHLSGAYGLTSKPATAIHAAVTGNCEACHKTTSSWLGAKVDHSTFTVATNCASCHNGSSATGKSGTHIPTTATCGTCHNVTGWTPSKWNHTQTVVANQCGTCHTGSFPPADGPVSNHIPYKALTGVVITNCDSCHKAGYSSWNPGLFHTNVSVSNQCASCHLSGAYGLTSKPATAIHASVMGNCEACHKTTSSWLGAKVDHSTFTIATNCASCHNGSSATGKSGTHIPTTATCGTCHNVTGWTPSKWNHTQTVVANQCGTCHTGAYPPADGPVANHIPYKSLTGVVITNCDSCHKGGYASWNPGRFHMNVSVSTQCATCHLSGVYGLTSKPATAIHASVIGNCESCHKTTSTWLGAKVDHSTFTVATNCASCHNGSSATGKSGTHIPTTATCGTCHNVTGWTPSKWNHTQTVVANQCGTCHTGAYPPADGPVANHIPYKTLTGVVITNCDSCHKGGYASWNPGQFHKNVSISSQCASCHLSGAYGLTSKPATPVHASVTGNCESCHKTTTSWAGAKMDHSTFTVATNCASCHNGTTATGKTGNHIPTTALCGVCHKSGYTTWFPGKFHLNVSVVTGCASCHATAAYGVTAKPATATHTGVTVCETCHKSTTNWLSVTYVHAPANAVGTGTCDTCHNGSTTAVAKSAAHIPVPAGVAKCDACHKSQVNFNTAVTMSHASVTSATCKSCHSGAYVSQGNNGGAMAKVANHVPEAQLLNGASMDCNACHSSTTTWTTEKMNHNASQGSGAGWCYSCHATGTNYQGNMLKKSLTHDKPGKPDCSTSGCHKPLGTKGNAYTKWN